MPTQAPTGSMRRIAADHADLGAAAGIAGDGLDLDDAVIDFGHFLGEQLLHEVAGRTRQENLRAARFAADAGDQRADAVTGLQHFARDLLVAADNAFGLAQIDDDMAEFGALDEAGDDLPGAVLEFFILAVTLGIADLLDDDLLGSLRGDAAEFDRRQRIDDEITRARRSCPSSARPSDRSA